MVCEHINSHKTQRDSTQQTIKQRISHVHSRTSVTLTFLQYLCDTRIVRFQFHLELGDFLVEFTQMSFNLQSRQTSSLISSVQFSSISSTVLRRNVSERLQPEKMSLEPCSKLTATEGRGAKVQMYNINRDNITQQVICTFLKKSVNSPQNISCATLKIHKFTSISL